MRAGTLRHTVTVQKPNASRTKDAVGETLPRFTAVIEDVGAWVQPQAAGEHFQRGTWVTGVSHVVTMRAAPYMDNAAANWRLIWKRNPADSSTWKTLVFVGEPIEVDGKHRELNINCIEGERPV